MRHLRHMGRKKVTATHQSTIHLMVTQVKPPFHIHLMNFGCSVSSAKGNLLGPNCLSLAPTQTTTRLRPYLGTL